jgi:hypothetical protein
MIQSQIQTQNFLGGLASSVGGDTPPPDPRITWSPASTGGFYNEDIPFANLAAFRAIDPATVTNLYFNSFGGPDDILSISNIQTLTNLQSLGFFNMTVGPVDISGMTSLTSFSASQTGITSVNTTGCDNLTDFSALFTPLASFTPPALMNNLALRATSITSIDLTNQTELHVATLDLSQNGALVSVNLTDCQGLEGIDLSTCGNVATFTVAGCYALEVINIANNKVVTLNIADTVARTVIANDNLLTSFTQPASPSTADIFNLNFNDNQLPALDVSNYINTDWDNMLAARNSFPQAQVDFILSTLANMGSVGNLCDLSGVGNAAPSPTGETDKVVMMANGWGTVTTN